MSHSTPGRVYPTVSSTPADAATRLRVFCAEPAHVFWPDVLTLTDPLIFDLTQLQGHKQLTDLYLAALASLHGGRLATFDTSIPVSALVAASQDVVEVIPTI